jgi:hypothetical protein
MLQHGEQQAFSKAGWTYEQQISDSGCDVNNIPDGSERLISKQQDRNPITDFFMALYGEVLWQEN